MSLQKGIGAWILGVNGLDPNVVVAGSGADGTEQFGTAQDRLALGSLARLYFSCLVSVVVTAVLAATETATIVAKLQESVDLAFTLPIDFTDPNDSVAATGTLVLTGGGGGTTERGVLQFNVNLMTAQRFIRMAVTPTISTATVDTAAIAGALVFGGADVLEAD